MDNDHLPHGDEANHFAAGPVGATAPPRISETSIHFSELYVSGSIAFRRTGAPHVRIGRE